MTREMVRRRRRAAAVLAQARARAGARAGARARATATAPEEARAAIQEGAGMGERGCARCALGMLGGVGARRRGV